MGVEPERYADGAFIERIMTKEGKINPIYSSVFFKWMLSKYLK